MDFIKGLLSKAGAALGDLKLWAGKKVILAALGVGLATLKAKFPDWPLPSEDFLRDLIVALLSAHTLTDVVAIFKTAGKEVLAGKAQ
jgi:hypothetical protein